jgi:hypothetical protein
MDAEWCAGPDVAAEDGVGCEREGAGAIVAIGSLIA